jgi:arylsulfatase A-like enzyme
MSSGKGRRFLAIAGVGFVVGQLAAIADLVFVMWKEHLLPYEVLLLKVGSWAVPMAAYNLALFLPVALLASLVADEALRHWQSAPSRRAGPAAHFALTLALVTVSLGGFRSLLAADQHSLLTSLLVVGAMAAILVLPFGLMRAGWLQHVVPIEALYRPRGTLASWLATLAVVTGVLVLPTEASYLAIHPEPPRADDRPNVLLVVLDTMRGDALSRALDGRSITPNLDKLAREGLTFRRALSASPWSLPSHASMFTGLYPSQHGASWQNRHLDSSYLTLAEFLRDRGYQTVGYSENPFVGAATGLSQGFSAFRRVHLKEPIGLRVTKVLRDRLGSQRTREYTESTMNHVWSWCITRRDESRPFFLFLNLMAPHLPHYPRSDSPAPVRVSDATLAKIEPVNMIPELHYLERYRLDDQPMNALEELYASDIAYLDAWLGRLFQLLEKREVLDRTVVIVTSDHGENFGDHDLIEHQFSVYNSLLHVPLVLRYPPAIPAGTVADRLVSTASLFATVAELTRLPIEAPVEGFERRSVLGRSDGPILAQYENAIEMLRGVFETEAPDALSSFDFRRFDRSFEAIVDDGYKLIRDSRGAIELYDMETDWQESRDLASQDRARAAALSARLDAQLAMLAKPMRALEAPQLDPTTEEALRDLGYVD